MKGIGNFPAGQTQPPPQPQPQPSVTSGLMRQTSLDSIMSENLSGLDDDHKNFSEFDASENQVRIFSLFVMLNFHPIYHRWCVFLYTEDNQPLYN